MSKVVVFSTLKPSSAFMEFRGCYDAIMSKGQYQKDAQKLISCYLLELNSFHYIATHQINEKTCLIERSGRLSWREDELFVPNGFENLVEWVKLHWVSMSLLKK